MSSFAAEDRRIRALRPPKPRVDPYTAHGSLVEEERRPDGRVERALTVFLAGAECPFTCSFCDLWRYTIEGPTPPGALPTQLRRVLDSLDGERVDRVKLYNASNFFDARAVPTSDVAELAALCAQFGGVTVESHVNTIGARTLDFARRISGRLEVAVGLETIHPVAATRINKRLDLARFDESARFLGEHGVDLRVFVLLGAPYVPAEESVEWTVRTVEHAAAHGATLVAIIPVRGGNGEVERIQALGHFTPPTLVQLEEALERSLHHAGCVVTADLWDAERLPACERCRPARVARLQRMNLGGRTQPSVDCEACGAT
ncbi:MAG: radical SAM protein [Gemmatimonadaceae bacterium]|nr:radical SAM protein [Gemmatimonadaceae bacterium]